MDSAVALVQTYLRVNGYFTVTELPVAEIVRGPDYRMATDLDLLACRFPAASQKVLGGAGRGRGGRDLTAPDPALEVPPGIVDMIVGEVKESTAEFNPAGLRRDVLAAALARFGCCEASAADEVVARLLSRGHAETHSGHVVRLVAFGAKVGPGAPYLQIPLRTVWTYLEEHVRRNWDVLGHTESKDATLSFLMLREKARLLR